MEDEFYRELLEMAERQGHSLSRLVTRIDATRRPGENLSSAIRIHVLESVRSAGRGEVAG